jgi:hypothetical protein
VRTFPVVAEGLVATLTSPVRLDVKLAAVFD